MTGSDLGTIAILLTHSRSCSTVIERVFWANPDIKCFHEHFGDAYYFGPEKLSDNWKHWSPDRIPKSGKAHVTYRIALEDLFRNQQKHRYVFSKDMSYHIIPPNTSHITSVDSLVGWDSASMMDAANPTLLPTSLLQSLRFAFLIRSPWSSAPSLYKLHQPPAVYETGETVYKPAEMGYREMRMLIEYLYPATRDVDEHAGAMNGSHAQQSGKIPRVIDATDVLANPEAMLRELSDQLGLPFSSSMLSWEPNDPEVAEAFSKFPGFHNDALASSGLLQRTKDETERAKSYRLERSTYQQDEMGMQMTKAEYMHEWTSKWGEEGANKILETVNMCKDDYVWLKRFTMKPD